MSRQIRSMRCPESVLGWIPWYGEVDAAGERLLDERQRGAVEAHASECADCRAELDMIAGAPFEIDVPLPDPDRLFAEITARIDAGEGLDAAPAPVFPMHGETAGLFDEVLPVDAASPLSDDEVRQLTRWVLEDEAEGKTTGQDEAAAAVVPMAATEASAPAATETPARVVRGPWGARPALQALAAAAVFALGLLGGATLDRPYADAGATTTALDPMGAYVLDAHPGAADSGGAMLDVVFRKDATASEIGEALRASGLEIVSGPSSVGRYRLRAVAVEGADAAADLQVLAARLKEGARPIAFFAEPALP